MDKLKNFKEIAENHIDNTVTYEMKVDIINEYHKKKSRKGIAQLLSNFKMKDDLRFNKKVIVIIGTVCLIALIVFPLLNFQKITYLNGNSADKTKNDVIMESDIIIKGSVNEILPGKWSNPDYKKEGVPNVIQTDILINIEEVFKGTPYNDKTISVRINGGTVGNQRVIANDYPSFKIKGNYILLLSKDVNYVSGQEQDHYVLTGLYQGAYLLDESSPEKVYKICTKFKNDTILLSGFKEEIENVINSSK